MKALVYVSPMSVDFREEPEPETLGGDALVAVNAVGICGSDMHGYLGHDARRVPPLILGHEAAGTALTGRYAGERVVLNPLMTCGRCRACVSGRTNLCPERKLIGMNRPGAFAERIAIPEANLIPIPEGLDATHAALVEPAATALHALHLGGNALPRPVAEARALVIGAGSVGLLSALFLRAWGAAELYLGETNPLRLATAREAGIDAAFDPRAGGGPPDGSCGLVVDAVGSPATRAAAIRAAQPGGVIVHIGLADGGGELDVRTLTLQEMTFIGSYTYTRVDLEAAAQALHTGSLGALGWVQTRPLRDGARAFDELRRGASAAAKIVLLP